jgi:glycosyltransferase involved in cell wall biosynthesis
MGERDSLTVTVLIDTCNYGRYLRRAIDSALAQTYSAALTEILVIDDGSTDDTADTIQPYASRVRYIRKERGGQASALNEGIRQARGEVVCLLDADDYFRPDKVRRVVEGFQGKPEIGLVYNNIDIVDNSGTTIRQVPWDRTWSCRRVSLSKVPAQLQSLILLGHPWSCMTSSMSLRASVGRQLEIPEDVFPHSADLFLGMVLPFMAEVRIIETVLTAYVFHGENQVLFRSIPANRELLARQLRYVRRYVEDRFGKRFVTYFGRNLYGFEPDAAWQASPRWAVYRDDFMQIAGSNAEWRIKRESQLRLLATLLLSQNMYDSLRQLRVAERRLLRSRYGP